MRDLLPFRKCVDIKYTEKDLELISQQYPMLPQCISGGEPK
jgi:hypothetical protein